MQQIARPICLSPSNAFSSSISGPADVFVIIIIVALQAFSSQKNCWLSDCHYIASTRFEDITTTKRFFAIVMCTTCTMHMYEILMESFSFCYSLQLIVVVVSLRLLPFLSIFFFLVFFIPSNNASIAFSIFSLKLELHMIEDGRMHFAK